MDYFVVKTHNFYILRVIIYHPKFQICKFFQRITSFYDRSICFVNHLKFSNIFKDSLYDSRVPISSNIPMIRKTAKITSEIEPDSSSIPSSITDSTDYDELPNSAHLGKSKIQKPFKWLIWPLNKHFRSRIQYGFFWCGPMGWDTKKWQWWR